MEMIYIAQNRLIVYVCLTSHQSNIILKMHANNIELATGLNWEKYFAHITIGVSYDNTELRNKPKQM